MRNAILNKCKERKLQEGGAAGASNRLRLRVRDGSNRLERGEVELGWANKGGEIGGRGERDTGTGTGTGRLMTMTMTIRNLKAPPSHSFHRPDPALI